MTQAPTRTPEQVAIIRAAHETTTSLICDALPGTGKTTTLIDVIRVLKEPSAIVLAFNKKIAEEMSRRLPLIPRHRIVHVKTLHSAGFWITRHHFPRLDVSGEITEQRIRAAAGEKAPLRILGASTKLLASSRISSTRKSSTSISRGSSVSRSAASTNSARTPMYSAWSRPSSVRIARRWRSAR